MLENCSVNIVCPGFISVLAMMVFGRKGVPKFSDLKSLTRRSFTQTIVEFTENIY